MLAAASMVVSLSLLTVEAPAGASVGSSGAQRAGGAPAEAVTGVGPVSGVGPGTAPAGHAATGASTLVSANWAGYVETASTTTDVSGTWNEPQASCTGKKYRYSAFWVGMDGFSSNSVEQIGTDSDCDGKDGPSYYAWYEMYPANPVYLDTSSYPVSPGDSLTGQVSGSGTTFTVTLTDSGKWNYQAVVDVPSAPALSSGEWIAEAPSLCSARRCKIAQLADFGTVSFSNAEADGKAISAYPYDSLDIGRKRHLDASTSALNAGGNAFSVTWSHS